MRTLRITWFGHSTFLVTTPGGVRVLFDPWFADNPSCPASMKRPPAADLVLVSHGHADHIGDLVRVARDGASIVVGSVELCEWLRCKGPANVAPMNIGGSQTLGGLRVTMTDARHSSSLVENGHTTYMGEPAGYVLTVEDGTTIYFAGDTALFGDMRLIGEIHAPQIAFLPIGDRFTMGPSDAARACRLLGVRQVVPMHWGTFPMLTGTPAELRQHLADTGVDVIDLQPGESTE